MIKLGVLGSTKGTDLQAIINAINSEDLKAQVSVVISDRSKSYILERARLNQIPSFFVSVLYTLLLVSIAFFII